MQCPNFGVEKMACAQLPEMSSDALLAVFEGGQVASPNNLAGEWCSFDNLGRGNTLCDGVDCLPPIWVQMINWICCTN